MTAIPETPFHAQIRRNIAKHGHHITTVAGGPEPRFAYTIGLANDWGAELALPGALLYDLADVGRIVNEIARRLRSGVAADSAFVVDSLGIFQLRPAHRSWIELMLLGVLDIYRGRDIPAYQIVPDAAHRTLDVPDLSAPWSATSAPAWRWLRDEWDYPIPEDTHAGTNIDALRGARVTEASRWEDDYCELFAGGPPDDTDEPQIVPIGVLLGHDPSLRPVLEIRIEQALRRDADRGEWTAWKTRSP